MNRKHPAELHPLAVCERPFERWGVDLVGTLRETSRGNKYIFVATEYLTRTAEAVPLPDKRAETALPEIMKIIFRYGPPQQLLHDQGTEFCNTLNRLLCEKLSIKQCISSAYHPQTNG